MSPSSGALGPSRRHGGSRNPLPSSVQDLSTQHRVWRTPCMRPLAPWHRSIRPLDSLTRAPAVCTHKGREYPASAAAQRNKTSIPSPPTAATAAVAAAVAAAIAAAVPAAAARRDAPVAHCSGSPRPPASGTPLPAQAWRLRTECSHRKVGT